MRSHYGALAALMLFSGMAARAEQPRPLAQDDAKPAKPITLAYIRKEGTTSRYKITQVSTVGGMEVPSEGTTKITVKEVKPTGEATVIVTSEGGTYTLNGMENAIPPGSPIITTYDKAGRLASYKAEAAPQALLSPFVMHLIALAHHVLLPDKAVKIGDSWKTELDNPAVKDKKIAVTDTLAAQEKTEGVDSYKITQKMEMETETGDKITCAVTSWLDAANGQLLKSEETVEGVPTQYGKMDWVGKLARLKSEGDKKEAAKKDAGN